MEKVLLTEIREESGPFSIRFSLQVPWDSNSTSPFGAPLAALADNGKGPRSLYSDRGFEHLQFRWHWADHSVGQGHCADADVGRVSAGMALEWASLRENVRRWERLPADWDGEDGIAPPRVTADAAINFLGRASAAGVPPPTRPRVSGDGEIDFRWKRGDGFASAAFLPQGQIVAFCRAPDADQAVEFEAEYSSCCDLAGFFAGLMKFA
ncbi:MAG: hypothetical protein M3Y41_16165 [Pseudomonadota bacterium]|nr:hypothetical protein [Pseudomonadota bacterium]